MAKCDVAVIMIYPAIAIVRAAVYERIAHPVDVHSQRFDIGLTLEDACYAAHLLYCRLHTPACRQAP
jgi:hypothetical protein